MVPDEVAPDPERAHDRGEHQHRGDGRPVESPRPCTRRAGWTRPPGHVATIERSDAPSTRRAPDGRRPVRGEIVVREGRARSLAIMPRGGTEPFPAAVGRHPRLQREATLRRAPRAACRRPSESRRRSSSSTTAPRTAPGSTSASWRPQGLGVLDGAPEKNESGLPPAAQPGQGRRAAARLRRGDRRHRPRPGRGPRVRPARRTRSCSSRSSRARPTSSTARRFIGDAAPRALLLAHGRATRSSPALEHVHEPEPHRHGDLLQGLPRARCCSASRSSRTASASSRRSPPRSPKRHARIFEVPISYAGRTYEEGKKIGWKDGFIALWTILRYAFVDDQENADPGYKTLLRLSRAERYNRWMLEQLAPGSGSGSSISAPESEASPAISSAASSSSPRTSIPGISASCGTPSSATPGWR